MSNNPKREIKGDPKIAARLKEERKRLGLKAIEVYTALNISQTTLANYEEQNVEKLRDIRSDVLAQMHKKFGYDIVYVITGRRSTKQSASIYQANQFTERLVKESSHLMGGGSNEITKKLYQNMRTAEDTLLKAGAVPDIDYTVRDLLNAAAALSAS